MKIAGAMIALVLAAATVARAGEWQGKKVVKDGVLRVVNPATPFEADVVRATAEAWRIGGGDDVVFGSIDDVAVDAGGVTYLLDSQTSTVHVVSTEGVLLRSIGGEGEGPAEFRMGTDVILLADSNVCVLQVMPARAVLMTRDGDAAGEHPLPRGPDGSHAYLNGGALANGRLVLNLASFIQKETSIGLETSFVRVDPAGRVETTYWTLFQEQDLAKVTFDEKTDAPPVWAAGPDGRFYVNNDFDAYAVEVVGADGTPAFVIERAYEPLPKDERDVARTDSLVEAGQLPAETRFSTTHRAVLDLLPRSRGELWVLTGRGLRELGDDGVARVARFDAFDDQGRFVRRVAVEGAYVRGRDDFHVVGDRVYVVTNVGEFASDFARADDSNDIAVICLAMKPGR